MEIIVVITAIIVTIVLEKFDAGRDDRELLYHDLAPRRSDSEKSLALYR